jgi:hypothetical protein
MRRGTRAESLPSGTRTGGGPRWRRITLAALTLGLVGGLTVTRGIAASGGEAALEASPSPDPTGVVGTVSTRGALDPSHPFFRSLGTNGRACSTCHRPGDAWTLTPAQVQDRFAATEGLDPLFRPHDGATCPTADVSTAPARLAAYRLLLAKGLFRVGLRVPASAAFSVVAVDSPHGCADTRELSVYRRPLPATNLRFLTSVMWDGRETVPGQSLEAALTAQAAHAVLQHAQATTPPTARQLEEIVAFETGLFTAQAVDAAAGPLDAQDGLGGPHTLVALARDPLHSHDLAGEHRIDPAVRATAIAVLARVARGGGASDASAPYADYSAQVVVNPAGDLLVYLILADVRPEWTDRLAAAGFRATITNPAHRLVQGWAPARAIGTLAGFRFVERIAAPSGRRTGYNATSQASTLPVFDIFGKWLERPAADPGAAAREAVARGERTFNGRPIAIRGVAGLNDAQGSPTIVGTCTTCHNAPNVGNYTAAAPLNIGISDASRRTPDLPLFTLRCAATGEVVQTTDPGRALVTGQCGDIGKVKVPILRGLSARTPYFHNGSAATLMDVVTFYDGRFQLHLTTGEMADLVAFLRSL